MKTFKFDNLFNRFKQPHLHYAFKGTINPSYINSYIILSLCLLVMSGSFCLGINSYHPVYTDPLLEPWRWQVFPELSGLGAHCIAEGADGTIWFGTSAGAWSYNGVDWTYHSPEDCGGGNVSSICLGPDGNLYFVAGRNISRFDGQHWELFLNGHRSGLFPDGEVRKIAIGSDGTIWGATSRGLLQYDQTEWTLYTGAKFAQRLKSSPTPLSGRIELLPEAAYDKMRKDFPKARRYDFTEVCVDLQGRVWLGTEEGEILCFDPPSSQAPPNTSTETEKGKWSVYNETDGMFCGRFPSILATQAGQIWVVYAADSGYADVFNGQRWDTIDLKQIGIPIDCGNPLQTRDGVIWLSGRYVICALRDGQWYRYEKPEVPVPNTRNFLLQASDGALWMGGSNTEIMRVDYQTTRWLTLQDLNFQWESPAGDQWFLHRDGRVVVHKTGQWISYGGEDGVIDAPVALIGTRNGDVWVAGSHENVAATARYDGSQWNRGIHNEFSWGIDPRGVMESSDGSVWFSATVDSRGPREHCRGILQYKDGKWIHHHQPGLTPQGGNDTDPMTLLPATQRPEPIGKYYCLGESEDGRIWAGRNVFVYRDENNWSPATLQPEQYGTIETMFSSRDGALWVGTQQFGALRYMDGKWQSIQGKDSLVANTILSIIETSDDSIWMATDRGFSHYDGRTWDSALLPEPLNIPTDSDGTLKTAISGALWINQRPREWNYRAWPRFHKPAQTYSKFQAVRYQFRRTPPETVIKTTIEKVSPPGNLAVFWGGSTPWRQLKDSQLYYSYRLDDQEWSPFSPEAGHSFFALPIGQHHLEVRTRDRDFNIDPTPDTLTFEVLPPIWYQARFILPILLLVGLALAQSARVVLERSRLRKLTGELDQQVSQRTIQLETANKELEAFAYSVSHDLRAPLRHIDGFVKLLEQQTASSGDKQSRHYMSKISKSANRMGKLIDDLLSFSRTGRQEMSKQQIDLGTLVHDIIQELDSETAGRDIHWSIASLPIAVADYSLTRAVLVNLISNALKFTRSRATAEIEIGYQMKKTEIIIFVRDNGVGFDQTYSDKLFKVFQRLHRDDEFEGTGIGLANVHRIITRHGGRTWAKGNVNQGATFYISLPLSQQGEKE